MSGQVPTSSGNFGDLLDTRFNRILMDWTPPPTSIRGEIYTMDTSGKADERASQIEPFERPSEFGTQAAQSITYQGIAQGYDSIATHREFASGFQVQRKLVDDEQYRAINRMPTMLRNAFEDMEEHHASRPFRLAFSVDNFFYTHTEGVALCSNSHTNNSGTSTTVGYDNLTTTALSATNLTAMRLLMSKFRNPASLRMSVAPDTLLCPPDLYDTAYEIIAARGQVDSGNNNPNVHEGQYRLILWDYLTGDDNSETNNYFLIDSRMMKNMATWWSRVPYEQGRFGDFDTFLQKWRAYIRYSYQIEDWRWNVGASVT